MATFANPFSGNVNRNMSNTELYQAIRIDIAAELEAVYLYDAHAKATDDPVAKATLEDIRDEEIVHIGELLTLMSYLNPEHTGLLLEGEQEVADLIQNVKKASEKFTVGSLIENEVE